MTMTTGNEIVNRIDNVLAMKGLKRASLYIALGLNDNTFSLWKKRGTIPNADLALKIANYLGVSVEYLITGKEDKISPYVLEIANQLSELPQEYQDIIKGNIQAFMNICKKN